MSNPLAVNDRVHLSGGYDFEPRWLAGGDGYYGVVLSYIPGQNQSPAAVVGLDLPIAMDGIVGQIAVLELRHVGADWGESGSVHVELCDFMPSPITWNLRRQGKWVEAAATYTRI